MNSLTKDFGMSASSAGQRPGILQIFSNKLAPAWLIVASGTLGFSCTSSHGAGLQTDALYPRAQTTSYINASPIKAADNSAFTSPASHSSTVSELRRFSGLTWEQLGTLFSVSRRSMHFWASGSPLNAHNEALLVRMLSIIREADRGDAHSNRAALFTAVAGVTPFDLLTRGKFEEASKLLGKGQGRQTIPKRELSPDAQLARAMPPPEQLVGALHDRIHRDPGKGRGVKTVRIRRSEA